MKNFTYIQKTKIIFGKDEISKLKTELKQNNVSKLLLVYGKQAIKNLGIYDYIVDICKQLDIELFEESGVKPNPDMDSVRSGVKTCKENDIDFVLGAGGGSAIDCAKAIALGAKYDGDIWDIFVRKDDPTESLPVGVVITLAATGTETNGNSVISNNDTNEKRAFGTPLSVPIFAIIDPTYTLSVNHHHTIAGSIDIMMHIFEQYFSNTDHTLTSDYMSMGILKSIIHYTNEIVKGNDSYDARSNIFWASTLGWNSLLGIDKIGDWATHRLSYPLTKEYGVTHGYALAMLFPSWLRIGLQYNQKTITKKLTLLGQELFATEEPESVILALEELFTNWGANVTIKVDKEITDQDIQAIADNALALGNVGTVYEIDIKKAVEIYKLARC